jgi:hypothetical protein
LSLRRVAFVLASFLSLSVAACAASAPTPTPSPTVEKPRSTPTAVVKKTAAGQTEITVYLSEPTGTYQTGTATLTGLDGKTRVVVDVAPSMAIAQPIHIHVGACSAIGTIADKLEDVVLGKSTTEIDKPISEIASGGKAINVHLSAAEIRTYTACGEIPAL